MTKYISFLIIISFALLGIISCSRQNQSSPVAPSQGNSKASDSDIEYWTCGMHPQIHSPHPGKCPICDMQLVPVHSSEAKHQDNGEVHLSNEGISLAGVNVERVEKRELSKELLIFGTIGYNLNLHRDVVSLVEGRIERQFVDFNQTEVKKGDPLVAIYSMEAIQLQEEYLKALRERWLSTFYERNLLNSMVELAEERLTRIGFSNGDLNRLKDNNKVQREVTLHSPNSGSIVGNMVHVGELAKKDEPLYHIVPLDQMWFNGQVFESDLGLLKLGQKIHIITKSYSGQEFEGELTYIGRALDPANRTVPVRFTLPNPDRKLIPNLSATGQIDIPVGKSVLSIPNSAVLDLGTRHVVYVQVNKGVFSPRDVLVGYITAHYTQILSGLTDQDEVVVLGAFLIDAQSQLRRSGAPGEGSIKGSGSTLNSPETLNDNSTPLSAPAPSAEHHH
jgi:Cu(I)/Ag(I) efflux system membrane fusion protein